MTRRFRTPLRRIVIVGAVLLMAGCSPTSASGTNGGSDVESKDLVLPASFEGEMPCADCQGVFYHLDLFEDRVFLLRTTKIGHVVGTVFDSIGSWEMNDIEGRIALFGGGEAPSVFRIVDRNTLRKLDADGNEIDTSLDYDLRRKDNVSYIEPRLSMRGMYRYMADAAIFEECLSGRRFQVAQEADNIALERAYLDAGREPGEPLLISLQGRIAERPAMEGDAMVLTVVPERFLGVWPGESCGARGSISELENTYLNLTRLGDQKVPSFEGQQEAHIVLHSEGNRVGGTGGCNRFSGTYELEGLTIEFGPMATTMMACPGGKDVDLALAAALENTTSFRKEAHHFEFLDAEGSTLARFEARELQ